MKDPLAPQERSIRMGLVKGKNTKPELVVRKLVYALGYRYRLHCSDLPGSPDIVFRRLKKVIFIHGCFWHRHHESTCKLARVPKSKLDFWLPKLESNRERDLRVLESLKNLGWDALIVWECQLSNIHKVRDEIMFFLGEMQC